MRSTPKEAEDKKENDFLEKVDQYDKSQFNLFKYYALRREMLSYFSMIESSTPEQIISLEETLSKIYAENSKLFNDLLLIALESPKPLPQMINIFAKVSPIIIDISTISSDPKYSKVLEVGRQTAIAHTLDEQRRDRVFNNYKSSLVDSKTFSWLMQTASSLDKIIIKQLSDFSEKKDEAQDFKGTMMEQYIDSSETPKNAERKEAKVAQALIDDIIDVASRELLNEDGSIKKDVVAVLLGPHWQKLSKTQIILSFFENLNGAITIKIDEERRKNLSLDDIEQIQSVRELLMKRVQWQWGNSPEVFKQYIEERTSPVTPTKIETAIENLNNVLRKIKQAERSTLKFLREADVNVALRQVEAVKHLLDVEPPPSNLSKEQIDDYHLKLEEAIDNTRRTIEEKRHYSYQPSSRDAKPEKKIELLNPKKKP